MEWATLINNALAGKIEVVLACGCGAIGAMATMVNNKKSETFINGVLNVIVGMIVAAGAATKFGDNASAVVCVVGLFAGAAGRQVLETVARLVPNAVWSIIAGNVERFGGKPIEREKNEDK